MQFRSKLKPTIEINNVLQKHKFYLIISDRFNFHQRDRLGHQLVRLAELELPLLGRELPRHHHGQSEI